MKVKITAIIASMTMVILLCGFTFPSHSDKDALKVMSKAQMDTILRQAPRLKPGILDLTLRAYWRAKKAKLVKKPIIVIIDFTLASSKKRFWVINVKTHKVLYVENVAHGKGSGYDFAKRFSNVEGTKASSIGIYLTGPTYIGKNGRSLRLYGLDKGFDDNAYKRTIVIHPAWYVNDSFITKYNRAGRSWGCPALDQVHAEPIITMIENGAVILAYYPDESWLKSSKFINPEHKSLVYNLNTGWQLI